MRSATYMMYEVASYIFSLSELGISINKTFYRLDTLVLRSIMLVPD